MTDKYPDLDHTCHVCRKHNCKLTDGCPETCKGWRCSTCWDMLNRESPQGLDKFIAIK